MAVGRLSSAPVRPSTRRLGPARPGDDARVARRSVMAAALAQADGSRPHDLLWLRGDAALDIGDGAPAWVTARRAAGAEFSPVVVRRAAATGAGRIPVGLRGATRGERWAAQAAARDVLRVVTPEDIARARGWREAGPLDSFAAVRLLARIAPLLDASPLAWGVAGGVGHALATGRADVLRPDSDLDLLLRAPSPADARALREVALLLAGLAGPPAGARIDVQVETPLGAFSLAEWSRGAASMVLLKTAAGPVLVADPWRAGEATPGPTGGERPAAAVEPPSGAAHGADEPAPAAAVVHATPGAAAAAWPATPAAVAARPAGERQRQAP